MNILFLEKARRSIVWFVLALFLTSLCQGAMAAPPSVTVLFIEGAISPASADYINRGITHAVREQSQLVVLTIDTPGGLDTSMRSIIKGILASPVPVATYVAPSGARAASAGTYILYASHVAAMAPGTNLGAATPVQIGGSSGSPDREKPAPTDQKDSPNTKGDNSKGPADTPTQQPMTRKQVNDAAAYIRGLAQMRARNPQWAEQAVREAVSLSAEEALKLHVIEYIATDLPDLMKQIDGKKVDVKGQSKLLHTAGAPIMRYQQDWRVKLLSVITDPSIALILMAIGIYGLIFEFLTPGMVLPGVLGGICLLLALYALQLLPVNYAGLALIMLGITFMVSEAFFPSGALGVGGIVAFVIGAVILIDTELPGYGIPIGLIATVAVMSAVLIIGMATIAVKTRRRAVVIGENELIGTTAEVLEDTSIGEAWARIHSENWRVKSKTPLRRGQKVRVLARIGLVLEVMPIGDNDTGE